MNLKTLYLTKCTFEKLRRDRWAMAQRAFCDLVLEGEGCIRLDIYKGFVFNFRSGPLWIDWFLPKIGNAWIAWMVHDALYGLLD